MQVSSNLQEYTPNIPAIKKVDETFLIDKAPYSSDSHKHNINASNIMDNMMVPPPMKRSTEKITDSSSTFITGDIEISEDGELLRKYLEQVGFVKDIVEAEDTMLMRYSDLVRKTKIKVYNDIVLRFSIKYEYPMIQTEDNQSILMTPLMARERKLTYSGEVKLRMYFVKQIKISENKYNEVEIEGMSKEVSLGYMPVMIGSSVDTIRGLKIQPKDKINYGECPYDIEGYFIINGNEYVILNQDGLLYNKIMVFPLKDFMLGAVTILKNNNTTEIINVFKHPKTNTYRVYVNMFGDSKDYKRTLNIFQLFRLFGIYIGEDIMRKILYFSNGNNKNKIISELATTLIEYNSISEDDDYAKLAEYLDETDLYKSNKYTMYIRRNEYIGQLYNRFFPQYTNHDQFGEIPSGYVDQFGNELIHQVKQIYPNNINIYQYVGMSAYIESSTSFLYSIDSMGNSYSASFIYDTTTNNWTLTQTDQPMLMTITKKYKLDASVKDVKLNMFSILINKVIDVNIGVRSPDNKNGWSNKMIKTPSWHKYKLLTNKWNRTVKSIKVQLVGNEFKITPNIDDIKLRDISFTDLFVSSFTTNWEKGNWKKEERVTDLLSRYSIIAAYSYVTRISAPGSRKGSAMSVRSVEHDQYGFVDFIDTPEGKNCGLLRNKAVGCWISVYRDINPILVLMDNNYKQYISNIRSNEHSDLLITNGSLYMYCNGPSLYEKLSASQRRKEISFDVIMTYINKEKTLYIETGEGRLIRPLMLVDQNEPQQLVLYHKIKEGIVKKTDSFDKFMEAGCIEYVSPWKQDSIMLAESLNDLKTRENNLNEYISKLNNVKQLRDSNNDPTYISMYSNNEPTFISKKDYIEEIDNELKVLSKLQNEINEAITKLNNDINIKIDEYENYVSDENIKKRISDELNVQELEKEREAYKFAEEQITFEINDLTIDMKKYIENIDKKLIELDEKSIDINDKINKLKKKKNKKYKPIDSEYFDETISNIKSSIQKIIKRAKYTHCELDPNSLFGMAASIIPHPDYNQGPRNTYGCNMIRQALGIYLSNYRHRTDKTTKLLATPTRPVYETQMNKLIGLDVMGGGEMVVLAIISYLNYGEEDAIIMNKGSLERNLFTMRIDVTVNGSIENKKTGTGKNIITIIDAFSNEFPKNKSKDLSVYDHLDDRGIAKVGSLISEGDCVIGIKRTIIENGKSSEEDKSVYVSNGEDGIVDRIIFSKEVVQIKIRRIVDQVVANKFASRYAQKSTSSILLDDDQMPLFSDGSRPSIIMNPHAIPSRMTNGQLTEMVMSKAGVLVGERVNATAFNDDFNEDKFKSILRDYGYNEWGWEIMTNGMTGERFMAHIFSGPVYYQALKHHVQDKAQVRRGGLRTEFTRQPVGGRPKGGGLRFGEMERDVLLAHGASKLVENIFMRSSDLCTHIVCTKCNLISYQDSGKRYRCPSCETKGDFGRVDLPHSAMILNRYFAGAGLTNKFATREPTETERPTYIRGQ